MLLGIHQSMTPARAAEQNNRRKAIAMRLVVNSYNWARRHKREFEAVITLEDPDTRRKLRFSRNPHPDHLVLTFVDMDRPPPHPYCEWPVFTMADRSQVERAIEFGRDRESLLVHCQVGIGRSTAIALAVLASRMDDEAALRTLLEIRPEAVPNLHVVALADNILSREGNLVRVVTEWDSGRAWNRQRRVENRRAHFTYYGLKPDI